MTDYERMVRGTPIEQHYLRWKEKEGAMMPAEKQQILDEVLSLHGSITHEAAENIADYIKKKFFPDQPGASGTNPEKEQLNE